MYDCDGQKPINPLQQTEPVQPVQSDQLVKPNNVEEPNTATQPNQVGSSTQPSELDDELNNLYRYLNVKPEEKDSLDEEL